MNRINQNQDKFFKKVIEVYGVDLQKKLDPYPEGAFTLQRNLGLKYPVVGICDAGPGIHSTDMGYPAGISDEWLSRPAGLADLNAYALRIPDDAYNMYPTLRPGMFCVVSPNTECRSGDLAVIKFKDGTATIKEVHFKDDNIIELRSYNNKHEPKNGFT